MFQQPSPVTWWRREVALWGTGVNSVGCLVVLLLCLLLALWILRPSRDLPPGPWGLPLVGYLPWLNPRAPHLTLAQVAGRYGKVFSVRLGRVLAVVLADPAVVRDTLAKKETTGRAPLFLTHGIMHGYGLICSEGEVWREHRKFVVGFMKEQGMRTVATRGVMEPKIKAVAEHLAQELADAVGPVEVAGPLLHHVGNMMNQLIFGVTYEERDPTWRWLRGLLQEGTKLIGVGGPINFLPWLRFLPYYRRVIRFLTESQVKTHGLYQEIFNQHENALPLSIASPSRTPIPSSSLCSSSSSSSFSGSGDKMYPARKESKGGRREVKLMSSPPLHIVDAYIKERRARGEKVGSFTWRQIQHVAADLFGAGSETTITTLQWHLLTMALHPEAQERVCGEVDAMLRRGCPLTLACSDLLPYTLASIFETQRLHSILPLGIPHGVTEDMQIGGYRVPKGSMLLPFLWAIHHDPEVWANPYHYRPERFLGQDGKVCKLQAFMPFQTGRRVCIGDEFAKMILFHFTTTILSRFRVEVQTDGKGDPSADPISGISLTPRPFKLLFRPRNFIKRVY